MKLFKRVFPIVTGIFLIAGTAAAQGQQQQPPQPVTPADTVSEAEMETFVSVAQDLREVGQNIQTEVQAMVKEEGMEFKRFQMILTSKRNPQMAQNIEVTQEENQILEKLKPKLQEIQRNAQQEQLALIKESDLSLQRFQRIAKAVDTDPELRKRFENMASDTSASDGGGEQ